MSIIHRLDFLNQLIKLTHKLPCYLLNLIQVTFYTQIYLPYTLDNTPCNIVKSILEWIPLQISKIILLIIIIVNILQNLSSLLKQVLVETQHLPKTQLSLA